MTIPTLAYAIKIDGRIDTRTIFDTRIGAIINWLCTAKGIVLSDYAPDSYIIAYWERNRGDTECVMIEIIEIKPGKMDYGNDVDR